MATSPQPRQIPDFRGKHRKQVELNRLNQEIRLLQKELEDLEKTDCVSVACKELVMKIENTPDPLLSRTTNLGAHSTWNRWFEQPAETKRCCWIC